MPHKRNPVGSENLSGLARVIRGHSLAALENVALWHERDISHSSVERIIFPDSTILIDYMLVRLNKILKHLDVYPDRMLHNLNLTGGLVYSQRLLLALVEQGATRKESYEVVQRHAMTSWKKQGTFQQLIAQDPYIKKYLSPGQIASCFEPKSYLRHQNLVFSRVFGRQPRRARVTPPTAKRRNIHQSSRSRKV